MAVLDPWQGHAGETIWSIAGVVVDELADLETHDRRTITNRIVERHDANPGTVKNVIHELSCFGAIDRPGKHNIRLTPLGAQWWNNR